MASITKAEFGTALIRLPQAVPISAGEGFSLGFAPFSRFLACPGVVFAS